jgi:hypothetical protein
MRIGKVDLAIVFLLLILCVFQIASVQKVESFGSDSSVYIVLAHNLREVGQYEFNYERHTQYPPGFPVLLAGIETLVGNASYEVFVRFMPLFSTSALILRYFLLKRAEGGVVAGASCLLVATSAPLYQMVTRSVLSDAPFFLVSGLAVWCLMSLDERPASRGAAALLGGLCLATVVTVLIRSVGVALCAAIAAWAIAERWRGKQIRSVHWRGALLAAMLGFIAFFSWISWAKHLEKRTYEGQHMVNYAGQFSAIDPHKPELGRASVGDYVVRFVNNIPVQASHLAALAVRAPYLMQTWYSPLPMVVLCLLACGLASCACNGQRRLLGLYFLAYFSVYLLWPFDEGPRFMLPVAPLAFTLIYRGVLILVDLLRSRPAATLTAILAFAACASAVSWGALTKPGLQVRLAVVFWACVASGAGILLLLLKRAGAAARTKPDLLAGLFQLRGLQSGIIFATALLVAVGILQQVGSAQGNLAPQPTAFRHHASADVSSWLQRAKDGPVMAQQYAIIHRLTSRRVVDFPITSDPKIIVKALKSEMVQYLVVNDEVEYEYFLPTEEVRLRHIEAAYPSLLQLVHRGPGYRVFAVIGIDHAPNSGL